MEHIGFVVHSILIILIWMAHELFRCEPKTRARTRGKTKVKTKYAWNLPHLQSRVELRVIQSTDNMSMNKPKRATPFDFLTLWRQSSRIDSISFFSLDCVHKLGVRLLARMCDYWMQRSLCIPLSMLFVVFSIFRLKFNFTEITFIWFSGVSHGNKRFEWRKKEKTSKSITQMGYCQFISKPYSINICPKPITQLYLKGDQQQYVRTSHRNVRNLK